MTEEEYLTMRKLRNTLRDQSEVCKGPTEYYALKRKIKQLDDKLSEYEHANNPSLRADN